MPVRPMLLALVFLLLAPAAPALAGGPIVIGDPEPDSGASPEAKKGFELFVKRDYKGARAELEKALEADPENDEVRGFLARIAYFYAEDDAAREHLGKMKSKGPWDEQLLRILDTPWARDYKDAIVLMSGISERGHYHVSTDLGFDQAKWSEVSAQYAQLKTAAEKSTRAKRALEAFLKQNRSEGWKACQKSLDDIYEQYEAIFPKKDFPKDPKLVARVFFFKERADYLDFCQNVLGKDDADSTGGIYFPTFRLLVVSAHRLGVGKQLGGEYGQAAREVAFHEAFHQYIDYFIEDCPSWLNEGLAEFFATADEDPKTGRLTIGKVVKEPVGAMGMTNYQITIGALKPTARFPLYPIHEFVRLPQDRYYGKEHPIKSDREARASQNYAQGWAVCYFLIMGHPKGKRIIVDYIKALKAGKENEEAIAEAFKDFKTGADWEKLDKQFRAFFMGL